MAEQAGPPRVLVVDDDDDVRTALRRMFESAGYEVLEAANGRVAMQVCAEHRPELLLVDIFMPEQEGIETIQAVRRQFPDSKIVAVSGKAGRVYLRMAKLLGAQATLEKPLRLETVLETARAVLGDIGNSPLS